MCDDGQILLSGMNADHATNCRAGGAMGLTFEVLNFHGPEGQVRNGYSSNGHCYAYDIEGNCDLCVLGNYVKLVGDRADLNSNIF